MPVLDPAVDGCSNAEAKFYCISKLAVLDGGGVVSVGAGGSVDPVMTDPPILIKPPVAKRQVKLFPEPLPPVQSDCASWGHYCPTGPIKPPEVNCGTDFYCGFGPCVDLNAPRPLFACKMMYDPVRDCEQSCFLKHGTCVAQLTGSSWECVAAKSTFDYESCVASCHNVIIDPPQPIPLDKCNYFNDKCNCENSGCGWCESTYQLDTPISVSPTGAPVSILPVGYCSSLNSQFQCVSADRTFTTSPVPIATDVSGSVSGSSGSTGAGVSGSGTVGGSTGGNTAQPLPTCRFTLPPVKIDLPPDPAVDKIDVCLLDSRCTAPVTLNSNIKAIVEASDAPAVAADFIILVTAIADSNEGHVSLTVDVTGNREPTTDEKKGVCTIVSSALAKHLGLSKDRITRCDLSKITKGAQKRQASQTNSYIANMEMSNPQSNPTPDKTNSAASVAPWIATLLAALLA